MAITITTESVLYSYGEYTYIYSQQGFGTPGGKGFNVYRSRGSSTLVGHMYTPNDYSGYSVDVVEVDEDWIHIITDNWIKPNTTYTKGSGNLDGWCRRHFDYNGSTRDSFEYVSNPVYGTETNYSGSAKVNYYWPNSSGTGYALWKTDTIYDPNFTYSQCKAYNFEVKSNSSTFNVTAYNNDGTNNYKTLACSKYDISDYGFEGWSTSNPGGISNWKSNTGAGYGGYSTADITLYPVFTFVESGTIFENNTLSSITNPTRSPGSFSSAVTLMDNNTVYDTLYASGTITYTFVKWTLSDGSNAPSTFTQATNIYATWTENKSVTGSVTLPSRSKDSTNNTYTLSFDSAGGNSVASQTAGTVSYVFEGWFNASYGGTKQNTSYTPPVSGATLYAQWTTTISNNTITNLPTPTRDNIPGNTYTISFDGNTGTVSGNTSVSAIRGKHVYTFLGWYNNGVKVTQVTITGNMTLVAMWDDAVTDQTITLSDATKSSISADLYTTILDPNNGFVSQTEFKSGQKNYTFDGWYTAKSGGDKIGNASDTYAPTATRTVYAHWIEVDASSPVILPNPSRDAINGTPSVITLDEGYETGRDKKTITVYLDNRTYVFAGWYTAKDGGEKVNTTYYANTSRTLYAHWTETIANGSTNLANPDNRPNDEGIYTLYFDPGEGTVTIDSKSFGSRIYTFTGWFTGDGTKVSTSNYTPPSGGITLYAIWSERETTESIGSLPTPTPNDSEGETYTVNFRGNGGTATKTSISIIRGLRKYGFDGWYTDSYGGTKLSSTYVPSGNMTAYAHWSLIEEKNETISLPSASRDSLTDIYTVDFEANGGTVSTTSKTAGVTEYEFDGWYTSITDGDRVGWSGNTYIPSTTSTTLYAHWISNDIPQSISLPTPSRVGVDGDVFTVRFDGNEGIADISSKQVIEGRIVYSFIGWYTDPDNGDYVGKGTYTPDRSITLYAHWDVEETNETITLPSAIRTTDEGKYTVTFDPDGGIIDTETKYAGRTNYFLNGWYNSETGGSKIGNEADEYRPTGNITLFAHWDAVIEYTDIDEFEEPIKDTIPGNKYTVTFDGNGGTSEKQTISAIRGKVEYIFLGWFNNKGVQEYAPFTPTANCTLKAKWEEILTDQNITLPSADRAAYGGYDVKLNFDPTGGQEVDPVILYINKIAYSFDGWYTNPTTGAKVGNSNELYIPNSNTTFYAHWNEDYSSDSLRSIPNCERFGEDKYVVTLNSMADSVVLQQTKLNAIRHMQYEFLGWFTEVSGGNKITTPYTPGTTSHSITLYAHWGEATQLYVDPVELPQSITRQDVTTHVLHYDPNGGIIVGAGSAATAVIEKTTDYTFLGWYTTENTGGSRVNYSYIPPDNITLFARYTKSKEVASSLVHPNNLYKESTTGECIITLKSGDSMVSLATEIIKSPKITEYTFDAWYVDGVKLGDIFIPSTDEVYALAKWKETNTVDPITLETLNGYNTEGYFTVTFDPTTGTMANNTIKVGKLRHIFDGWTIPNGTLVPLKYTPTEDITLTGKWSTSVIKEALQLPTPTPNNKPGTKRTVYFNGNTGSADVESIDAIFDRIDYDFVGWLTPSNIDVGTGMYTPESDITLTAKWDVIEYSDKITLPNANKEGKAGAYTITFNPNGGTVNPTYKTAGRTEFRFAGWFTKPTDGTFIGNVGEFYTPKTNGETLYANWNPYVETSAISLPKAANTTKEDDPGTIVTITLDTDGGIVTNDKFTASIGGTQYKFNYWMNSDGEQVSDPYTPNTSEELTAVWAETKFDDVLQLDIPTKNVLIDYEIKLDNINSIDEPIDENPVYASKSDNYSFLGWYNSNGEKIEDNTNFTPTKTETLTAKWQYMNTSNNPAQLPSPSKLGYDFVGWATTMDNPEDVYTASYMPDGDTTLYAIWAAKGLVHIGNKTGVLIVNIDGVWYRIVPEVYLKENGQFNICI